MSNTATSTESYGMVWGAAREVVHQCRLVLGLLKLGFMLANDTAVQNKQDGVWGPCHLILGKVLWERQSYKQRGMWGPRHLVLGAGENDAACGDHAASYSARLQEESTVQGDMWGPHHLVLCCSGQER